MIRLIKRIFFGPDESYIIYQEIVKELKKLDHSKWYTPEIPYLSSNCNDSGIAWGWYDIAEGDLVPDLLHKAHPDLDYQWYDGPFAAYPETNRLDIKKLIYDDRKKLLNKFREFTYNELQTNN